LYPVKLRRININRTKKNQSEILLVFLHTQARLKQENKKLPGDLQFLPLDLKKTLQCIVSAISSLPPSAGGATLSSFGKEQFTLMEGDASKSGTAIKSSSGASIKRGERRNARKDGSFDQKPSTLSLCSKAMTKGIGNAIIFLSECHGRGQQILRPFSAC
jgi:hypothetical protein